MNNNVYFCAHLQGHSLNIQFFEEKIIVKDSDTYFYTQCFFHKSDRFQSR